MGDTAGDTGNANAGSAGAAGFWRRIKDHRLAQWTVAYVGLAYAIQHAVVLTGEAFEWPQLVQRTSMLLLVLGLPLMMTLAWYHGGRATSRISGPELSILTILLLGVSVLFYVFVRPAENSSPAAREAGVTAARQTASGTRGTISIAVLPFLNLSSDKEQEFFSDGMTEEITTALAKVPDLHVVARTSAFEFKGKNANIMTMGEQLGATHLIEGSVRKAGNRVRISAQLIKAADGTHIWADDYDRELTDVFQIQEEIAQAIAAALQAPLGLRQGESLVANRSIDPDLYQQYLRARALVRARKSLPEGAALLEQVVARDANYAPAWAVLADSYASMAQLEPAYFNGPLASFRGIVETTLPKAEAAARHATTLNPNFAYAYVPLAMVQGFRGNYIAAEDLFKKALALDPNDPDALHRYGNLLAGLGRVKEALVFQKRSLELEPFVPVFNRDAAIVFWLNGQNEAATTMLNLVRADDVRRASFLAIISAAAGRYGDAADALLQTPKGQYSAGVLETAATLLRTAGKTTPVSQNTPNLRDLEFVHVFRGDTNRILSFYEEDLAGGYTPLIMAAPLWHPAFASVRKTERFKAYVRKAGMVDYWRAKGWPPQCHPTTGDDFVCN